MCISLLIMKALALRFTEASQQIMSLSRVKNESKQACDRCHEVPAIMRVKLCCTTRTLTPYNGLCEPCILIVHEQLGRAVDMVRTNVKEEAYVHEQLTHESTARSIKKVYSDFVATRTVAASKPAARTVATSKPAARTVSASHKAAVLELLSTNERFFYQTLDEYKKRTKVPSGIRSTCFCCSNGIDGTDPVYDVGGRWLMCVRCRDELITGTSSVRK